MRKSKFLFISLFSLFILFTNGCGFISFSQEDDGPNEQPNQVVNNNTTQTQQQNKITPVQPNQVNAEVPFDPVSYIPYNFKPRTKGGIYVYTKEAHAGTISDDFKHYWDEKDMLYVQLGNQFKGYEIEPMALEKLDAKTIRLVLKLKPTEKVGNSDADPARKFIRVPKGSLNGYSFEIVDESGKQLNLQ